MSHAGQIIVAREAELPAPTGVALHRLVRRDPAFGINQILEMQNGRQILLLDEKIKSADSTWLAVNLQTGERVICCNRFLRQCKFIAFSDKQLKAPNGEVSEGGPMTSELKPKREPALR